MVFKNNGLIIYLFVCYVKFAYPDLRTIGLGMLADVFPNKRLGVVMGTVLTAHTV